MKTALFSLVLVLAMTTVLQSQDQTTRGPDCSGRWPTIMSLVHLKNAGLIDASQIEASKTTTVRLASEKTGKNLWRQVYYVTFVLKSGEAVQTIAVHDASLDECSMAGVEVFVVSHHLNVERR